MGSLILAVASCVFGQQNRPSPLTNNRVIELVQHGVQPDELRRIIETAPQINFLLTPSETNRMQNEGVTVNTIKTMAARENGQAPADFINADNPTQGAHPRVFVTDSPNAWSANGWVAFRAGSHPQRAEIMKTIHQRCTGVTVTNQRKNADYVLVLERESNKVLRRDNKMIVFNRAGDLVYSASTRALGNAVKGACEAFR